MTWNLGKMPEDLDGVMREIAKADQVALKAAVIYELRSSPRVARMLLGGSAELQQNAKGTPELQRNAKRTTKGKFTPPTDEWAAAKYGEKGYHFDLRKFMATYRSQGWKLGNGRAMTDCEATMEKWEANWKERQEGNGVQVGRQEYDTSGNKALVEQVKAGKGW